MPTTKRSPRQQAQEQPSALPPTRHGLERREMRKWREARGLTIQKLASLADLSIATVEGYENARTRPTLENAEKIAAVLDLFVEQLAFPAVSMLGQPKSKWFRGYDGDIQKAMVAATTQVITKRKPLDPELEKLQRTLQASGLSPDEVETAVTRVRKAIEEDRAAKGQA